MTPFAANDLSGYGRYAPRGWKAGLIGLTRRCPASWAGKRGAFILRGLAVKALGGRPLDVEALGVRMRLYPRNNTCEKRLLFTPQYFDLQERTLLASRIVDDFVFIDIGANVGGYALFVAARAGPRARILAIEPQPEIFERLVYNVSQNPFSMVKALDCAVADRPGEVTLFLSPHNRGETSMKIVDADGYDERVRVTAKTLQGLLEEEGFDRVDAIKLDTEGAADLILEPFFAGAPQKLWPKLLLMENTEGRWSVDIERILERSGYREVLRTHSNVGWERD
ncbi:MAG TPA: FkbM family methyltransferase [Beijerinckiaceae bacterium]|nr:FkbM family methyltransferase [Beijerinckiaceae bacterium]